mmetsp:Transcript_86214/g.244387  ORF Transcript_86214/g.244387 Transcript_86214/m.244387 type:complete len:274 (+) Transcript_86214:72-893(+)
MMACARVHDLISAPGAWPYLALILADQEPAVSALRGLLPGCVLPGEDEWHRMVSSLAASPTPAAVFPPKCLNGSLAMLLSDSSASSLCTSAWRVSWHSFAALQAASERRLSSFALFSIARQRASHWDASLLTNCFSAAVSCARSLASASAAASSFVNWSPTDLVSADKLASILLHDAALAAVSSSALASSLARRSSPLFLMMSSWSLMLWTSLARECDSCATMSRSSCISPCRPFRIWKVESNGLASAITGVAACVSKAAQRPPEAFERKMAT